MHPASYGAGETIQGGTLRHRETVMGTVFCLDVALADHESERTARKAVSDACALLREIDARFSLWKADSSLSRYRRGDVALPSAELQSVFAMCAEARERSGGWFDAGAMPGGVDPTGLVKGWAGDRALATLVERGCVNALVNAAGDVAVSGGAADRVGWRIGIQHPGSREHLIGVVTVQHAIATSGCYERGPHLYDPKQKRYTSRYASATVVGRHLWLADALATALAVAGQEGFTFIEALAGYEAIAMRFDGTTQRSSGWSFAD